MASVKALANHIERTVHGPMWHGPALMELLEGVSPTDAAATPITGAHSIWQLVLHIAFWADEARARFSGQPRRTLAENADWPAVPAATDDAWRDAQRRLASSYEALRDAVGASTDAVLSQRAPGSDPPHSMLDMLHGVIEHGTYHGGQIALLKRAIG